MDSESFGFLRFMILNFWSESSVCTARNCYGLFLSQKLLFKLKKRSLTITSFPVVWRGQCGTDPLSMVSLLQWIPKATMSVMLVNVLAWLEERCLTSTAKLTRLACPTLSVSHLSSEGYGWSFLMLIPLNIPLALISWFLGWILCITCAFMWFLMVVPRRDHTKDCVYKGFRNTCREIINPMSTLFLYHHPMMSKMNESFGFISPPACTSCVL